MKDIAVHSEGSRVHFASCHDDRYPLENIIDGKWDTFWPTSGLFPQSFIVTFDTTMKVHNFNMQSYNVKRTRIECAQEEKPRQFSTVLEQDLDHVDRKMQLVEHNQPIIARHMRFIILSGHDHFVSINNLVIMAEPCQEQTRPVITFEQDFISHLEPEQDEDEIQQIE